MPEDKAEVTLNEDKFCYEYVITCENGAESVRRAWPDEHYNDNYIRVKAHDLLTRQNIKDRIEWHEKILRAQLGFSVHGHLSKIVELRDKAIADKDVRTAMYCQSELGKVLLGNSGKGVKSVTTNQDGTVKIEFTQPEE
jgi:hypothetical protein